VWRRPSHPPGTDVTKAQVRDQFPNLGLHPWRDDGNRLALSAWELDKTGSGVDVSLVDLAGVPVWPLVTPPCGPWMARRLMPDQSSDLRITRSTGILRRPGW
jgi:hypothetical protein